MSLANNQPVNNNFLSPLGYKFHIDRMPTFNFFVQSVKVPEIRLPPAMQNTPFSVMPFPGDHLQFDTLNVTFKMDEALLTYTEIFDWMQALGFPEKYEQYRAGTVPSTTSTGARDTVSDAHLTVLSSAMNPIFMYKFRNLFPTAIGSFNFDYRDPEVTYITCDVQFKFGFMTVSRDPQDYGA
jgi:hypothetical protein